MATPSQILKIEGLKPNELSDLMVNILSKQEFESIEVLDDCIKALQKTFLNKNAAVFISFPFKLGGTGLDILEISQNIKSIQEKYTANNVFVYSNWAITKGFQTSLVKELNTIQITYIGRDELIKLLDDVFPEYWRHDDLRLIQYEKVYTDFVANDSDLKKLKFPSDKYAKLLDIFIEPLLVRYYQDIKTNTPISKKYTVNELIAHKESLILEGEAGAGKSTLLKKIGEKLIEENATGIKKKHLPIYLSSLELFDAGSSVSNAVRNKLASFSEAPLSEIAQEYDVHLLIDSIDEIADRQSEMLTELNTISKQCGIKYYIASRNGDNLLSKAPANMSSFSIRKFNLSQIKLFLDKFFSGDNGKSTTLLDALRDNQMLEKLPITPLTLSLISILFEETEFEIPATISDIYDNFNTLIIGKAVVSNKIEFIDISFKERILSIYALKLLESPNHIPLSYNEFIRFFKEYFDGKSIPIRKGSLEDVLDYLLMNTGILYLKDGDRVQFTHDSYMEYYAALEIFKHNRDYEDKLIDNFYDPNWQNVAIFYAGESKDMPNFLKKIKEKMSSTANIRECMSAIFGSGYLLQALYQTDNTLRRDVIFEALRLSLLNLKMFEMFAADDVRLFKNYKLPILTLLNFIYFYESFNSITLVEPLRMSFDDMYKRFVDSGLTNMSLAYNLIELAFTLDSRRIRDQKALQQVIETNEIIRNPILNILASISLDLLGKERYKEFRTEIKKTSRSLTAVQKELVELPMAKLRFTPLDTIQKPSKVKILVEGKTDAMILEYAYLILTDGDIPYWSIEKAGRNKEIGSCSEVVKTLEQSYALWQMDSNCTIIGVFDHDAAGLGAYRGLCEDFIEIEKDKIKKHKDGAIFALCMPVPGEMDVYLQQKQEFNFFEMEHYMGIDYLINLGVAKETSIPGIYEIIGDKVALAQKIRKETSPKHFAFFSLLLNEIDKIAGVNVSYIE